LLVVRQAHHERWLQTRHTLAGRDRLAQRARRLLQENPAPTEAEVRAGMSGNLCRCTGYQNIVKAVLYAADKLREPQKEAA